MNRRTWTEVSAVSSLDLGVNNPLQPRTGPSSNAPQTTRLHESEEELVSSTHLGWPEALSLRTGHGSWKSLSLEQTAGRRLCHGAEA